MSESSLSSQPAAEDGDSEALASDNGPTAEDRTPTTCRQKLLAIGLLCVPFIVLVVGLARRNWYPTGDLAQAELRLRSLPDHIPLLGAAGRIQDDAGRQGNHPGPLMFWSMWPPYLVFGRSSWAFQAAAASVNLAWVVLATWMASLRMSFRGLLVFVALVLGLFWGFGLNGLSQPWNPWMALYPFLALIVATWLVVGGRAWAGVVAVVAGSFAVQCHVGYAAVAVPLVALALLWPMIDWFRTPPSERRSPPWVPFGVAVALGALSWSGPLVDFFTAEHDNVTKLVQNFGSPDDPPVGLAVALRTVVHSVNPFVIRDTDSITPSSFPLVGAAFLLVWGATAVATAQQREDRRLPQLNAVIAALFAFTVFGVSRIFGELYLYVFRWVEILRAMLVLATIWGLFQLVVRSGIAVRWTSGRRPRWETVVAVTALALLSIGTAAHAVGQKIPYEYSWKDQRQLAAAVKPHLDADIRYQVRWDDPVYLGGGGFGMMLELERQGFEVGAIPRFEAAVEPQRVYCTGDYDVVLTMVTGTGRIAEWDAKGGARKVGETDPSVAKTYQAQIERIRASLTASGRSMTADEVESNINQIFFFPGYDEQVVADTVRLIEGGAPSAVYLQDAGEASPTDC